MIMETFFKTENGDIACTICKKNGRMAIFTQRQNFYRHRVKYHPETVKPKTNDSAPNFSSSSEPTLMEIQKQLSLLVNNQSVPIVTNNNITNNLNLFFNKDLKYFNELSKIMGKENAINHLLYTSPKIKNHFDVLKRIFANGGMPICISDRGYHIMRNITEVDVDETGEIIDIENKRKLKDAVVAAYTETTRERDRKLQEIRLAQAHDGGEFRQYTADEIDEINSVFESTTEPKMLYGILDYIDNTKTRKCDFEDLRRVAPHYDAGACGPH